MPRTRSLPSKQVHQGDSRLSEKHKVIMKQDQLPYSTISKQTTRRSSLRLQQRHRTPLSDKTNVLRVTPNTSSIKGKKNVRDSSKSTPVVNKKLEVVIEKKDMQNEGKLPYPDKEPSLFATTSEQDTNILGSSILNGNRVSVIDTASANTSDIDDPFGFTAAELRAQQKKEDNVLPWHISRGCQSVNTALPLRNLSASTAMPAHRELKRIKDDDEIVVHSQELSSSSSEHSDDILPASIKSKSTVSCYLTTFKVETSQRQTRSNKRTTGRKTRSNSKDEPLTETTSLQSLNTAGTSNGKQRASIDDDIDAFVIEEEAAIAL
ncbi:hypothetical protein BDF22DRAFT_669346 [Syncephalis plumigaleata]|nr:hypothetical protein BDF22DRAFT_669346 [Syncephalis plumigaleata]